MAQAPSPRPDTAFTMAFQPIVDAVERRIFGSEALVRGPQGQGAAQVLASVGPGQRFAFHEACRVRAIEMAAALDMGVKLSLNVAPNDVAGKEECFRTAIATAMRHGFPVDQLLFEITEGERVPNLGDLAASFGAFGHLGITSAIDDFGAGYAGFELLAAFQPDLVKIDMNLVRSLDSDRVRRTLVRGVARTCGELGVRVIAEGVETRGEYAVLRDMGVSLFQGYLFARPAIGVLPPIAWDAL